jgi:hypothetical protein
MSVLGIVKTIVGKAATEIELREALARMKVVSERHAVIVAVMSRLGVSPQERRLAQSESKNTN